MKNDGQELDHGFRQDFGVAFLDYLKGVLNGES